MPPVPPTSSEPFDLHGRRASALLIHGYTSSPWEMRVVGDALAAAEIRAVAPLLPGHGTEAAHLDQVTRAQWIDACRRAYDDLDDDRPRFIVASSMGGLIGLILAAETTSGVDGLALLAPALDLFPSGVLGGVMARVIGDRFPDGIPKAEKGGDIGDDDARAANPAYDVLPLVGLAEFDRLRDDARAVLADVVCPVLLLHGAQDRTVRLSSSRVVSALVNAPFVDRELLTRSRHVIGVDADRGRVASRVVGFAETLLAPRRA